MTSNAIIWLDIICGNKQRPKISDLLPLVPLLSAFNFDFNNSKLLSEIVQRAEETVPQLLNFLLLCEKELVAKVPEEANVCANATEYLLWCSKLGPDGIKLFL